VTVLFTDVAESTRLAERLDVEELREVMSEWFAAVRTEIESQGGVVEKYIGDAVMAVFGVPSVHEDDPARALRAALAIREQLVVVNDRLETGYGVTMEIRTGINTGEALSTLSPAAGEAIVTGVAVNMAARLEQLAEPGQTIVAERTVRAAPGFQFDEVGQVALRGTTEPVRAFRLLGEVPNAPTRGLVGIRAPLVGRAGELELLLTLFDRVRAERRPHLVTIYGEPGVGKSRLVSELLERLAALSSPPRIVVGRCLSYGDGITYLPVGEILKGLAGISDSESAADALARVETLVAETIGSLSAEERELATAALAFTLGLDTGTDRLAQLTPSALRVELHRAWRTLLSALAEREPLVVVVDDIHWADPVLLDLIEELADRAQGSLLFLCPSRPELTDRRPAWGGGRRSASTVFLNPLSEAAAGDLVSQLLNVDGLRENVRGQILARAEGNPFFLEEILRQLIDEGRIVRADDRWQATDALLRFELPDTVQGVLAARMDLLKPREKRTLQHASVVGRIFWRGAVTALLDDAEEVDVDLRQLEQRELIGARLASSIAGEEELAFSHILSRDVAYESLPRRERPAAHARVARWIEETTGDRQGEYGALLAHHYLAAYRGASRDRSFPAAELESLRGRAFELLLLASHTALRGTAYAAAGSLAGSALDIASTSEERATALEALGDACRNAALGDEAWAAYSGAVDALRETNSPDAERLARLSGLALETVVRWTGTMHGRPPETEALGYLEAALETLGPVESEGRVRLMTSQAFWGHGYPESDTEHRDPVVAQATGEAAAEMAMRLGRLDLAVVALDSVQHNLQRQLRYEPAFASAQQRLELAHRAGDLGELGDSYAMAAWSGAFLGAFAQARDLGREGYDRLIADAPPHAVHSLSWAVLAQFYLGDWDGALQDFDRVTAVLGDRAASPTSGFASPWPGVAFIHEARGDSTTADELIGSLRNIEAKRQRASGILSPLIIRRHLLRGDADAARDRLNAVMRDDDEQDGLPLLLLAQAEFLLYERRDAEFRAFAQRLRDVHVQTGARYLAPAADRIAGHAAIAQGRLDEAVSLLHAAAAGYEALGMVIDAAVTRLDAAGALLGARRNDEAHALASAARTPLERARFRPELDRLQRYLKA
jgi:class 3 adenylate cyclase/tetratricopeptide (TPR) repeat protein